MKARVIAAILAVLMASLTGITSARAGVEAGPPTVGWRPTGGIVYAIERVGGMLVLGGTFTQMVSPSGTIVTRSRLAAIDAETGDLLPWNPAPNGTVRALESTPDGGGVYVGGEFTTIAGQPRANLAAVSTTTGSALAFSADTNGPVYSLVLHDGGLYAGGTFFRIRGVNRGGGAEVDPATGALRPWNPRTNYGIFRISPSADGAALWIGGPFTQVAGLPREFVVKVGRGAGALDPWESGSTCRDATNRCHVYDVLDAGDVVYLAVGGPGGRVTALDSRSGAQRWWTGADGDAQTLALAGDKLYAGGHWVTSVNGVPRAGVVALNRHTGAVLNEFANRLVGGSGVWQLVIDGDRMHVGGQFTTVDGVSAGRYVTWGIQPDPPDSTPPTVPGSLRVPANVQGQVTLTWNASSDNVAVVNYEVLRNGQVIASAPTPRFKDRAVGSGISYTYTVRAVDPSGNRSPASTPLTVTTPAARTLLVPPDAVWQFHSRGLLPAEDWMQPGASTAGWASGVAELGYGDGDEDTYISPLGVVHYFRNEFQVPDPTLVTMATLQVLADDGAVVYLNGQEISRIRVASGPVDNSTTASSGVDGNAEMQFSSVPVPLALLVPGRNVLAVSVHNSSAASSDISFNAVLTADVRAVPQAPAAPAAPTLTAGVDTVMVSWPAVAGAEDYEVMRDGIVVATTASSQHVDHGLTPETEYAYSVRARNAAGSSPASPMTTVRTLATPTPPSTPTNLAATSVTSSSIALTWSPVAAAESYWVLRDGAEVARVATAGFTDLGLAPGTTYRYRIVASNAVGNSPESEELAVSTSTQPIEQYVRSGDTWRFFELDRSPGEGWQAPSFDDSTWRAGASQLGYGDGDEATVLSWGSDPMQKPVTAYFRHTFYAGASIDDVTALSMRAIVDDGAVVYLNGVEVWRYNMPAGTPNHSTRASTYVGGAAESTWRVVTLPRAALLAGWNTIAVEVHQDKPSSSDLSMDLELRAVR